VVDGGDGVRVRVLGGDLLEQLGDALPEDADLLLLQGHAHHPSASGGLEEERALPGWPYRVGDEALGWVELGHRHACHPTACPHTTPPGAPAVVRRRSAGVSGSVPVSLRRRTRGPRPVSWTTETDAGSTTMRWNRSREVPRASARTALMTSPWLTATQTASSPCSRRTRASQSPTAARARRCISARDSLA